MFITIILQNMSNKETRLKSFVCQLGMLKTRSVNLEKNTTINKKIKYKILGIHKLYCVASETQGFIADICFAYLIATTKLDSGILL